MPGIIGTIGNDRLLQPSQLEAMIQSMMHEPFYKSGSLTFNKLNFEAGWICDEGSFSDCMPIWNDHRNICLIFWGEHFSDGKNRDAAFLVRLYEEHQMKFFQMLNGIFNGILIDFRENKIVLFNDRYGLARVYYHESASGFYFASEAKALFKVLPQLRILDMRSLGEFFSCGCALQNRSLFQGISLLPPGSMWTFRAGRPVEKQAYFEKESWESLPSLSPEAYYQQLKESFIRILPRYFSQKQPVALSLTGGLDSRMIIATAGSRPGTLPCYTFGGMYRDCEDVKIARQIAGLCQQSHEVIKVDEMFLPQFLDDAKRCVYITDGAMDASAAVGMGVNRKARKIAPVRMTGNYGSEILRGNIAFKPTLLDSSILNKDFVSSIRGATETYKHECQGNRLSFIAFKQVPWHHYCRFAEENSQLTIRSPYLDNELVRLAYQAPPGLLLNKQLALRYCAEVKPALCGVPTDRGNLNRPKLLPEKIYQLWKERWPRAEYYFDYGMPHWLAKLERLAPVRTERMFLGAQKYYHFRTWYRNGLSSQIKSVLLDSLTTSLPYLDAHAVSKIVLAHVNGNGNYTQEIHKLLTIAFIEKYLLR